MFGGLGVRPGVGADVPVTYRRQALWQLASSVAAGRFCGGWQALWQLVICTPLASCVTAGKLLLMYRWQALWQLVSWRSVNH